MTINIALNFPYGNDTSDFEPGRRSMIFDDLAGEATVLALPRTNRYTTGLIRINGVKAKEYYCNFHLKRKDRRPRGCRNGLRTLIGYKP